MEEEKGVEDEGGGLEKMWLRLRDETLYVMTRGVEVVGEPGSFWAHQSRLQYVAWAHMFLISSDDVPKAEVEVF